MSRISKRDIDYPLAVVARRAYLILEQMPDKERPKPPKGVWPAFRPDNFEEYLLYHPAVFETERDNAPAKPGPRAIDEAATCFLFCRWMWSKEVDSRFWKVFRAHAYGVPLQMIGERYRFGSKQNVSNKLNRIYQRTQSCAEMVLREMGQSEHTINALRL